MWFDRDIDLFKSNNCQRFFLAANSIYVIAKSLLCFSRKNKIKNKNKQIAFVVRCAQNIHISNSKFIELD